MNATILDLRKNMKDILSALSRNEKVTLTYRGKKKAVIISTESESQKMSAKTHPAFGMWAGREELKDVDAFVRKIRKGRSF